MRVPKKILEVLSRQLALLFLPHPAVTESSFVKNYLKGLWKEAPLKVALAHTVGALVLWPLPWFLLRTWKVLPLLSAPERERFVTRLLQSNVYPLRLLGFAVRGNLVIGAFRDPLVRQILLPEPLFPAPSKKTKVELSRVSPPFPDAADYVIIGSGAAGATAALSLAQAGKDVVVLEEGSWFTRKDFGEDLYSAMKTFFRDFGMQAARGRSVFPVMQGKCVGGTTVMNGAISHKLPEPVYDEWAQIPGFREAVSLYEIRAQEKLLSDWLHIRSNWESHLDKLPVASALKRLNWKFEGMRRSAPGCEGTGRCLQGCPSGGKLSMEASFIPWAIEKGARLYARSQVHRIDFEGDRAVAVEVWTPEGHKTLRARKGILIAAGVVHTPELLYRSGMRNRHLGKHFSCHLGVSVLGKMKSKVREMEGPPQGIEIHEFTADGIKLATQLVPPEVLFARVPVPGRDLVELYHQAAYISSWTASIRAEAEGELAFGSWGTRIRYTPTPKDLSKVRAGIQHLADLLFETGTEEFYSGIHGQPLTFKNREEARRGSGVNDARNYNLGVGHIFGTCRMGSSETNSVVNFNFQPHNTKNLYVIDASVFPSNTGVNPQLSIMALARLATERLMQGSGQIPQAA